MIPLLPRILNNRLWALYISPVWSDFSGVLAGFSERWSWCEAEEKKQRWIHHCGRSQSVPSETSSPPPLPFSYRSQGNRRVEGSFSLSIIFQVPWIWLFEINVNMMEGAGGVSSARVVTGDITAVQRRPGLEMWRAASPRGHGTEAVQEIVVRHC